MTRRQLKPVNYVAYGLNDILGAGSMAVISGWILFFYTTFCGLSAVQAASIFAIARILDAVASPLIGHISDGLGSTKNSVQAANNARTEQPPPPLPAKAIRPGRGTKIGKPRRLR